MNMNFEIPVEIAAETRLIRDVVYDKLKEAILSESLKPGSHLVERDLARQFNISTTPLKEALGLLKQEGLVITRPRIGTFVAEDIMNSIEEVNMVRSALEGVAARLAAIKITKEEAACLAALIAEMEIYTARRSRENIMELNASFHKMIRTFAKNNYVFKQIEAIQSFHSQFSKIALSFPDELEPALREHRLIFEKIAAQDADGAEEAIRTHVRRTAMRAKERTSERHR
jgi:DNA-binding GntR family transcriptional regulator